MSNPMPIYSQILPKSQYRGKSAKPTREFDPLNYNHGGNFQLLNAPERMEKDRVEKKVRKDQERSRRKNEATEGKVEAYLRQNQVSIRQQQHRHSAVKQAEHRVNLRSLPLNDVAPRNHDRTPTDRQRVFPERDKDGREHRRERDRDRDREKEHYDFDDSPLSPTTREPSRPVRKSSSAHRMTETAISTDKRRFFCREWAFQKIAHCLEQRPVSKTCGALILGDAGSGKTALCQELSEPSQGPQARQQRALNRRLLARYFIQTGVEGSGRPAQLVRSVCMQLLSHSARARLARPDPEPEPAPSRDSEEERLVERFQDLGDDGEDCSKPLLADSEDQRTDEEEAGAGGLHTMDAPLTNATELPEILPRSISKPTNPFIIDETKEQDLRDYENHENVFLRNISQRQSKELRNSHLHRQSSEPLTEKKQVQLQKSLSTENDKPETHSSPPKSRIPVANFRYPNKSELKPNSTESSPKKTEEKKESPKEKRKIENEIPEYQNVIAETEMKAEIEKKDDPPPIPSLPISPRTLIANAYYNKLITEPDIQQALLPSNLEKNPDECFKKALLFPLLEIDPPKQCLFLLVDAIDEGGVESEREGSSVSIAALLSRHQHLLPQWLLLVCTARRHSRLFTKMFTGFRKITLDELSRAHVSADVQRYVLARLDTEPRLRSRVSSDSAAAAAAAAALDHLRIKSDGCLLYLEKVLDGVADGFIALREIKEIPGTLNGLYLWLAQRLFHGRRFNKVRLLLDVLLAARCGVTEEMLYKCLLTKEYSVTREDFNRRMHLLRRIVLLDRETGEVRIFHQSFSSWLMEVKHCTRRYLCSPNDGHAALAMYYTLDAHRLNALEIHNYVYHMTCLEQHLAAQKKKNRSREEVEDEMELHTLVLVWVLGSGCDVEAALALTQHHLMTEKSSEEKNGDAEQEIKDSTNVDQALECIMPSLVTDAGWPRDRRVLRALLELSRNEAETTLQNDIRDLLTTEQASESEDDVSAGEQETPVALDPSIVHELAAKGDDETLTALLKVYGSACSAVDGLGGTAPPPGPDTLRLLKFYWSLDATSTAWTLTIELL